MLILTASWRWFVLSICTHERSLFTSLYGLKCLTKKPRGSGKKSTAYISVYSYFRKSSANTFYPPRTKKSLCTPRNSQCHNRGKFAGGKANEENRLNWGKMCEEKNRSNISTREDLTINLDIEHNTRKYLYPMPDAI